MQAAQPTADDKLVPEGKRGERQKEDTASTRKTAQQASSSEEWQHSPLDVLPSAAAGYTCAGVLGSAVAAIFLLLRILFALGSLTVMHLATSKPKIV